MYDVIIVGGGAVGSQVASRLAGVGCGVLVLEQKARLSEPVCCTGIISQECANLYAIDERVILQRANNARVFSPSGKLIYLRRQEPQACIVDRAAFNEALANRAQKGGAEYRLDSLVRHIEVKPDRVSAEVANDEGGLNHIEARAVVMATGFGSKLVERLGLGKVGDFVLGAQAEVEMIGVDEIEVYLGQKVAPGFFAWLVPTSGQRARVGLLSRSRPGFYLRRLLVSLVTQGKIASAEARLSYGGVPLKPLVRSYGDRVIVVGTAAGQVKPTTGGGIYYGLLCADIAAENLQGALESDRLSSRNLAHYEREWKKRLGQELKIGYRARQFFELLGDAQIDKVFDIIKSNGIDQALLEAKDLSFDWHGRVMLRLLGHQVLSQALRLMGFPFSLGKRLKGV